MFQVTSVSNAAVELGWGELILIQANTINNSMADTVLGAQGYRVMRLSLCPHGIPSLLLITNRLLQLCPPLLLMFLFLIFLCSCLWHWFLCSVSLILPPSGLLLPSSQPWGLSLLLVKKKNERGVLGPEVTGLEKPRSVGTDEDISGFSI